MYYTFIHFPFDRQISECDSFPKQICQKCWCITEAFHQLYVKAKLAQDKFLERLQSKNELDMTQRSETIFVEPMVEIVPIKCEIQLGKSLAIFNRCCAAKENSFFADELEIEDPQNDSDDSDYNYNDDTFDGIGDFEEDVDVWDSEFKTKSKPKRKSRRTIAKEKRNQFDKIFQEHSRFFDLTCEHCPATFTSFYDARHHYVSLHNISPGYVRCCTVKLRSRFEVMRHLTRHLDPEKYK